MTEVDTIEADFDFEEFTKNTGRFIELSDTPVFGKLYIQKSKLTKGTPKSARIKVEVQY